MPCFVSGVLTPQGRALSVTCQGKLSLERTFLMINLEMKNFGNFLPFKHRMSPEGTIVPGELSLEFDA